MTRSHLAGMAPLACSSRTGMSASISASVSSLPTESDPPQTAPSRWSMNAKPDMPQPPMPMKWMCFPAKRGLTLADDSVDFNADLFPVEVGDVVAGVGDDVDRAAAFDAPVRGEVMMGILSAAKRFPVNFRI